MRYPRRLSDRIESALMDTPVLLIHGPRQSGKSTLAQAVAARHGHRYLTLDDATQLAAASEDPIGFVDRLDGPVVIDEVQRVPELFLPIKAAVDRARDPGRFILTGSANLLRVGRRQTTGSTTSATGTVSKSISSSNGEDGRCAPSRSKPERRSGRAISLR